MFWLFILLLWPLPATAHVHWFVSTPEVVFTQFSLIEMLVGGVCLGLLLSLLALFTPVDEKIWQRITFSNAMHKWLPLIALAVALVFGVIAYHPELILVYLGLIGYALCWRQQPRWALTILAAGTGLAFTQAAFAEKLLYPEYSATFLQTHPWNFMQSLGVAWFTDRWFILQAGVVEAGLGIALTVGLAPRIAIGLLSVVCVITAILLGITEVYGHAPIVMAFLIYLIGTSKQPAHAILNLRKRPS